MREPPEVLAAASEPEHVLDDYVLVREIGHGGSGSVYKAWQRSLGRFVALKFLHEWDREAVERLEREARMVGGLSHPHIVPLYDVGEHAGRRFLTMRLIEGRTLRGVHVESAQAASLMRDVAEAVHAAHSGGVIHRDLKPGNLMLDESGHVWVMDFGLARTREGGSTLTMPGTVLGTPEYMAPEQAKLGHADERTDVYALGATLYELLTGRPPFEGGTPLDILTKIVCEDVVRPRALRPRLHPELESIVLKALDKDPARRYATARAFSDDLRRHLTGEVPLARPAGRLTIAAKWVRRHRVASAAVGLTLTTALLLASGATWYAVAIARERRATELKLAESLLAQGNALGLSGRWYEARERFEESATSFNHLGLDHLGPDLALLDVDHHAPPPLWTAVAHAAAVRSVLFTRDGRQAITAAEDGIVKRWDVRTARLLARIDVGTPLRTASLSPDERTLAVAGKTGEPRLYDLASGELRAQLAKHPARIKSLVFSPDGRRIATGAEDGHMRVFDATTREQLLDVVADRHEVRAVAFRANESLITGGSETVAREWDAARGTLLRTYPASENFTLAVVVSDDAETIATGSYDRQVHVWRRGQAEPLLLGMHGNGVSGVAFTPDHRSVLSASFDGTLRHWDLSTGKEDWALAAHDDMIYALGLSADGRVAMTGTKDGKIALWDVTHPIPGSRFMRIEQPRVGALSFSEQDRFLMVQGPLSDLRVWDRASGQLVRKLHHPIEAMTRLFFDRKGRSAIVTHADGRFELLDLERGGRVYEDRSHSSMLVKVVFTSDGERFFAVGDDGDLVLHRTRDGAVLRREHLNDQSVFGLALSPNEQQVLTSDATGEIVLWEADSGRALRRMKPAAFAVLAVAFSPDGRTAVVGGNDRVVRLIDLATGTVVRELKGHSGEIMDVGFGIGGRVVLSAGSDDTMRVWDVDSGQELHSYQWPLGRFWAVRFSDTGALAGVTSHDDSVLVWDFSQPRRIRDLTTIARAARTVLATHPDDPQALAMLGDWYAARGLSDWAVELLDRAAAAGMHVDPLQLAANHWRAGNPIAARDGYRRMLERLSPDHPDAGYLRQCLAAVEAQITAEASRREP